MTFLLHGIAASVSTRKTGLVSMPKPYMLLPFSKKPAARIQNLLKTIGKTFGKYFISTILLVSIGFSFFGCDSLPGGLGGQATGETSGPPFERPEVLQSSLNPESATYGNNGTMVDTSSVHLGYVGASASSSSRLKFQVSSGDMSYNYDLPNDGTPIICPLNMGSGTYSFTIWQNTSGNRYAELDSSVTVEVQLDDEFEPYLRPSFYCSFNSGSACVQKANELSSGAANEGEVLANVYNWIVDNVDYDSVKAASVADASGYTPNPDETLQTQKGICFDYSSLAAAMLRSQGIPCKIMTGYVSPDNIYHAWNMVFIDGSWKTASFSVEANTWTLIDTTFAAGGDSNYVGDGTTYTERYTY